MAKEIMNQQDAKSIVSERVHKSSGSAVPAANSYNILLDPAEEREWLVAIMEHQKYTTSCCEFIMNHFGKQTCSCYVPCKQELHVYPNRTKRVVTKFILPRFIFISGISEKQAYNFVPQWPHVDLFLPDRARDRKGGHIALAKIQHHEMVRFQKVINEIASADDISFTTESLAFDEQIEVVRGGLKGLKGGYYKDDGGDSLVFMLGKLGNIKVRVSIKDCRLKKTSTSLG